MARIEFKLPDIGEGVSEGEIVEWHVKPGDSVREDDPMVEVMTDKATVTIGAPKSGTIEELRFDVGATALVGDVIVVLDAEGASAEASASAETSASTEASPPSPALESARSARSTAPAPRPAPLSAAPAAAPSEPAATAVGDIKEGLPGSAYFARSPRGGNGAQASLGTGGGAQASPVAGDYFEARPLATPATRKVARDLGVDLRRVRPTGRGGRVLREDVQAFARGASEPAAAPTAKAPSAGAPGVGAPGAGSPGTVGQRPAIRIESPTDASLEDRKPFVGIRRKIAERMQTAKNTAAHFTFVEECDVSRLKDVRARLRGPAEAEGVRLSFLPFIVKAVVAALKKHPVLNSALDESTNELVYRRYYHVGIAAATDLGLMVPVVRDADRRSILDIAREIERLGDGARDGSLSPSELSGSTFTITSLGKQGGLFATPVLNFPEVGILGVHQMKQKPVVRDGQIVVGDVMLLSLSFDHRIVDGHVGAAFAYDIIAYLENPDRLLLELT